METEDFKQAIRAMNRPIIALLDHLVDKDVLTERDALIVADCAESVEPIGPLTNEAIAVLREHYDLLATTFEIKRRK